MSREEAATIYLDVLLGFRGSYDQYQQAAGALSDADTSLLRNAAACASGKNEGAKATEFFGALIENDNQYRKGGTGGHDQEDGVQWIVCARGNVHG